MGYTQPRVPPAREDGGTRELTAFLRGFCLAAWDDSRRKDESLAALQRRVAALEARAGAADGTDGGEG